MLYSLLIFLYGISWTIVYISFIRNGRKEKTYCMPFFCIIGEIMWEIMYAAQTFTMDISMQTLFFCIYGICAMVFLIQFFKYRDDGFPAIFKEGLRLPYMIISTIAAIALQLAFYYMWSYPYNMIYSCYIHTFSISFLLLIMLWIRGTKGYDLRIALFKLIGDTSAMILSSNLYLGENIDIAVISLGLAMFVTDSIFLISFLKLRKKALKS